jgi:hypothetical protein
MSPTNRHLSRLRVDARSSLLMAAESVRTNFYREEFLKHQECLQRQRESYSECTITEMEAALRRVMARVDELCAQDDADVDLVVSRLLRTFDGVTKLSAWSDPTNTH